MRVKQVDSLNEQRERIRYLRRKEEGRGVRSSNVFPAAPILSLPPRGFLSFLRPIDYPRYYLLSRLSTVSLRTCGLSLEREKMAYLGRFQRPDAATSPKGDHQSSTSPRHVDLCLLFFFFTLSFFLSSIGFRKKWKGDDKSCSLCFLFVLDREKERIPVSDSVWVNLTTIGDFIMRLIIGYILVALCLGGIFSVDL